MAPLPATADLRRQCRRTLAALCFAGAVVAGFSGADEPDAPIPLPAPGRPAAAPAPPAGDASPRPTPAPAAQPNLDGPLARLLVVPLPLTGNADAAVKRAIREAVQDFPTDAPADAPRPVIVLRFGEDEQQSGQGSEFERALSLARFLTSGELSRVRTVAYVPHTLRGHAVLAAMACDEIVMAPDAELGEAGLDEPSFGPTVRGGYAEIADLRRVIPSAVALGMLDPALTVSRVEVLGEEGRREVRYVLAEELAELEQAGRVGDIQTIIEAGRMGRFTGRELREQFGFVSHLASDERELAAALRLSPQALERGTPLGEWRPALIRLSGPIHGRLADWLRKAIDEKVAAGEVNLLLVVIESRGGDAVASLGLASHLAGLDGAAVRTVAFVPREAAGDAAFVAAACDHLFVGPEAVLGGPGARPLRPDELSELPPAVRDLGRVKGRDWSLWLALADPNVTLHRYTRPSGGPERVLSAEELAEQPEPQAWVRGAELDVRQGLPAGEALALGVARGAAESLEQVQAQYGLEGPLTELRPNRAHQLIENFARALSGPCIAPWLLFAGWFFFFAELSQPGLGIYGFLSGMCFLLFFWSQFLNGSAGWLEILLFAAGVVCVIVELFVTPGFGAFGVGGIVLIVVSIVLAAQTFVIPRTTLEWRELPYSLSLAAAGVAGSVTAIVVLRKYLLKAPFFRHLMLAPPEAATEPPLSRSELPLGREALVGKQGVAVTRLNPAGKARIGDEVLDVISDGDLAPRGAVLRVVEVQGSRIVVRPVEGAG